MRDLVNSEKVVEEFGMQKSKSDHSYYRTIVQVSFC